MATYNSDNDIVAISGQRSSKCQIWVLFIHSII
jgi:hypothetical protein